MNKQKRSTGTRNKTGNDKERSKIEETKSSRKYDRIETA